MQRWLILNVAIGTLAIFAFKAGLLEQAWRADSTWTTTFILAFLGIGFLSVSWRVFQCSWWLDHIRKPINNEAFKMKLASRVRPFAWLARCLPVLGFFGTLYGMQMALEAVGSMSVTNAQMASVIMQAMVSGFSVAIWTSLSGIVCFFVLSFNIQLLMGGYERLYTKSVSHV